MITKGASLCSQTTLQATVSRALRRRQPLPGFPQPPRIWCGPAVRAHSSTLPFSSLTMAATMSPAQPLGTSLPPLAPFLRCLFSSPEPISLLRCSWRDAAPSTLKPCCLWIPLPLLLKPPPAPCSHAALPSLSVTWSFSASK